MKYSKLIFYAIFLLLISLSIFLANVLNFLSTDIKLSADSASDSDDHIKVTDTTNNLIWFLQISDLHLSIFNDASRITEFNEFCHDTIDAIKPSVVLATGDLTDAKDVDGIGTKQYKEEWQIYKSILDKTKVEDKTIWLDIRGNHDTFDVAGLDSPQNLFTNYSVQGYNHSRSYMYQVRKENNLYTFIAIDASLNTGPRHPFNFIGIVDEQEIIKISSFIQRTENSTSKNTIFYGHFPTASIVSKGWKNIREIIGKHNRGLAYVCGHYHTLGGLVDRMYTLQKEGFLELELVDWKDKREYRLMAIDHGILSFTDIHHGDWPIVLITMPKSALFHNPSKENLEVLRNSTHIRILAFSIAKIDIVEVNINKGEWMTGRQVEGPLFVIPWNPLDYATGLHKIEIHVRDFEGREKFSSQTFSLDGTRVPFSLWSNLFLMVHANILFSLLFYLLIAILVLPLLVTRYAFGSVKATGEHRRILRKYGSIPLFEKIWILSRLDRIFWPTIFYPIYLIVGPWTIGYLVEDHIGVVFAWGIFVNGTFIPDGLAYIYGSFELVTFQLPLTIILANAVYQRFYDLKPTLGKTPSFLSKLCLHLVFTVLLLIQLIFSYMFWLEYGGMALLFSVIRTWSVIVGTVLIYQASHFPQEWIK
ncbi:unnamed protein product [Phaedon cochleariae]|uniref:Calcineurin-like phosphoesterase domain-containing protein n=1 Tax=Phaedon cochleariae TaxID=80249 RepID=A0A9P0DSQ4_PHACE|nr:unnamed protein product [Phaedon cochleariae]